jgi:hypothetical protein
VNEKRIRYRPGIDPKPVSRTDWDRLDKMTDEEAEAAARSDPDAPRDRQFATLAETVRVARSLGGTGIVIGRALSFDDELIALFDKMVARHNIGPTDSSALIISRLFHALDHCRAASVWHFALAADAAKVEPGVLRPVLDLLESGGGDVTRCREFLAFCAEG